MKRSRKTPSRLPKRAPTWIKPGCPGCTALAAVIMALERQIIQLKAQRGIYYPLDLIPSNPVYPIS